MPEYWGTGLAKPLMAFGLARLREAGCLGAVVWALRDNARALRFYEKCGFSPDGTTKAIEIGGRAPAEIRYRMDQSTM